MIATGVINPLVQLLLTAEFDIKKEAAWAISNATSGGTHDQIKWEDWLSFGFLHLTSCMYPVFSVMHLQSQYLHMPCLLLACDHIGINYAKKFLHTYPWWAWMQMHTYTNHANWHVGHGIYAEDLFFLSLRFPLFSARKHFSFLTFTDHPELWEQVSC